MPPIHGINVSSIPFEQRPTPPSLVRHEARRLSVMDRFVCATFGIVFGSIIWFLLYLTLLFGAMKAEAKAERLRAEEPRAVAARPNPGPPPKPEAKPLRFEDRVPFSYGVWFVLGFAIFGALGGPDRLLNGFTNSLRCNAEVSRAVHRAN